VLGTGAVALVSWLLLAGFSYTVTGSLLGASSSQMFEAASQAMSASMRSTYEPIERTTSLLAYSRLMDARDETARLRLVPLLIKVLRETPAAAAIQVGDDRGDYFIVRALNDALRERFQAPRGSAYEADILEGGSRGFGRWFYDQAGRLIEARKLAAPDYDPRVRPWYRSAMAKPGASATPPYVFYFMAEIGVTIGHASADRRAVVATDVSLASVGRALATLRVTPSSAAVLRDADGVVAWSGSAPALVAQADGTLRRRAVEELGHAALGAVARGAVPEGWLVHRTRLGFENDGSSELIIAVPEDELLADVRRTRTRVLLISLAVLGVLILLAWALADRIAKPLRALHEAISRVRGGDFDFWLPDIRSGDEVGDLNLALRTMRYKLKESIKELAAATAARERLESELDIARRIQMGFVPGGGRLSRTLPAADLFARLEPARAVGGDLYELIELPDGRLFIAIGDVSDKGVHAALLMSRVITLTKLLVPATDDLAALLRSLNAQLAVGNDECMFVTFFCAVVDPRTGEARCACAGHNPPLRVSADGAKPLLVASGPPLGLVDGAVYSETLVRLQAGEGLVLYTDGITEAFDAQRQQFGEQRLLAVVRAGGAACGAEDLGARILREVAAFTGGAPQSDDITLLVLRLGSVRPPLVVCLRGSEVGIGSVMEPVRKFADAAGLPEQVLHDVLVILDEILSNVRKFGGVDPERLEVEVRLAVEGDAVTLRLSDNGAPFDPLSAKVPEHRDLAAGGAGIQIVRALARTQHYSREEGRNVLFLRLPMAH
jgi:sigma-B regulation protein RsbU (phosphoserine phosphatase)